MPSVRLISLHKGDGETQLRGLPGGMEVETLGDGFDEGPDAFLDTAAVMMAILIHPIIPTHLTILIPHNLLHLQ